MSAPVGSYSGVGPRNTAYETYTANPDMPTKQTATTAGAPQSPIQAASEGNTLGPNPNNPTANMPTGHGYSANANMPTGHGYNENANMPTEQGYSQPMNTTTGRDYATAGPGQTVPQDEQASCGGKAGKSVLGVFKGIHGAGEAARGNILSAFDNAVGNKEAAARNTEIAQAGMQEMRNGFGATSRSTQTSR